MTIKQYVPKQNGSYTIVPVHEYSCEIESEIPVEICEGFIEFQFTPNKTGWYNMNMIDELGYIVYMFKKYVLPTPCYGE